MAYIVHRAIQKQLDRRALVFFYPLTLLVIYTPFVTYRRLTAYSICSG
jgi:hypothetical protein